jgi:REP element-mobilizing transposase RayT
MRGNRRDAIFLEACEFAYCVELLGEAATRFAWRVHAYCLMPNHVHLLLDVDRGRLSAGMHRLNWSYAKWFNQRHGLVGHLFQERFYAVPLESEAHVLAATRYVLLNPVRAGLCRRPAGWRWSSYRASTGAARRPTFLDVEWTLAQFGPERSRARAAFRSFVHDGIVRGPHAPSSPVQVTVTGTGLD